MPEATETRDQRFRRLAEQRVNVILDKIRLLGQLANKSNYDYTDAQVEAIFKAIRKTSMPRSRSSRDKGRSDFTLYESAGLGAL